MGWIAIVLWPLGFIYGCIASIRNFLSDHGLLKSQGFDVPILVVGNLSVGGTGKTPMVEWLVNNMGAHYGYQMATLSRGYGRTTKGFYYVETGSTPTQVGDEPCQLKRKFQDLVVAVDEKRTRGIARILKDHPEVKLILLDDAFQHRWVSPTASVLLTDFSRLYHKDFVLPAGRLREWKRGAKRASCIVVTKCPPTLALREQEQIRQALQTKAGQPVFFTSIGYGSLKVLQDHERPYGFTLENHLQTGKVQVLAVAGIARPAPFFEYLKTMFSVGAFHAYKDHHLFALNDLTVLKNEISQLRKADSDQAYCIVTTEKDAVRLQSCMANAGEQNPLRTTPIYYLPIVTAFAEQQDVAFKDFLLSALS